MSDFLKKIDSETKFYIFNMQNFSPESFFLTSIFEKPFLFFGKFIPSLRYRLEEWVFFAYFDKKKPPSVMAVVIKLFVFFLIVLNFIFFYYSFMHVIRISFIIFYFRNFRNKTITWIVTSD